ncbi:LAS seventeen-binding protein 3 [Seminavis robusta]|uniref:LAS seventeen-binding protein 3 n=1 Tax=Seminavis robusta TaxID=568900 RepID=A0A9N8F212_9STRA|nr:LAS seventeen-binding protein 3 [Seminavis robusta]|eukprot:Sro2359_g324690.1 LAS seventeen-binding protein 3 (213) ;mRNA; f:2077-2715
MNKVTTMEGMIESSLKLLEDAESNARDTPPEAFQEAFGIVILESMQAGFFFSAEVGTGILLRHDKTNSAWSPPLAIGLTGVGAGLSFGAEKKHMIIFLKEDQFDQTAMTNDFTISLGLEQSFAIGPIGESNEIASNIGNKGSGIATGYSTAVGLYTGLQAGGSTIAPRTAINKKFYGEKLTPKEILFGSIEVPQSEALAKLHAQLSKLAISK